MKRLLLILALVLTGTATIMAQDAQREEPLMRMAVLSDIHNELGMISNSNLSLLRLRPTFLNTLDSLKRAEKIDVLAMDGDYTSDCTISATNWKRIRKMMVDATRNFFPEDAERRPVLWVTGNHDYEVSNFDELPKTYNAGDYYSFPMKEDIGELAPEECFYEMAENGSNASAKLLAAYHYVVHGFDFVCINCGKYFFKSAWDYQYSQESIDWVDAKLAELTQDDPDRTIIVLAHLPLPSSVGATSNKTLSKSAASSYNLERALAKYPGVIYLYGHDHSSRENKSFFERSILQRFTCYDVNGNVIDNYGEEVGELPEETPEPEHIFATICNTKSGKYLSYDANNAAVNETPNTYEIYPSTDYEHRCVLYSEQGASDSQGVQHYIYCGSSGRFSGNTALGANSTHYFFEVPDVTTGEGTLVDCPEAGKTYAIVALSSKGGYYALSDEMYSPGSSSQRIVGVKASDPATNATQTFAADNVFWTLTAVETDPQEPDTWQDLSVNFQNVGNGTYLGFDTYNIAALTSPNEWTISKSSLVEGTFCVEAPNGPAGNKLHCGGSGRFSGNSALSNNSSILFYEVNPETLEGVRTTAPELGKTYALVALSSSGGYYAVTSEGYSTGGSGQRLVGSKCTNNDTQTFATATALWNMTENAKPEPGDPSYMSVFVGSMRYNSLETNATPNEDDPRMTQALVLELYKDSVVFTMKNFGETGRLTGAAVTANIYDPLPQYVVRRGVHGTTAPDTTPTPDAITAPAAATPGRVVSLTGIDLGAAATVNALPAGVYVVNGRKVVRK